VICVLAGGVGAARLLAGLVQVVPPSDITVVGNVGDDG
jgi:LPPG:FO 2-phospho-L-lactate transferase